MRRSKFAFVLSFLFLLNITVISVDKASASFTDVSDKYADEINYLVEEGIITGYPDGTFKPYKNVTREEAVYMIGQTLGLVEIFGTASFTDVNLNSFAAGHIESTYKAEIITGYKNKFRPDDTVKRGEMAVIISRAFDLLSQGEYQFKDVDPSAYYGSAVNKLTTSGLAEGDGNGYFQPEYSITREHFALLLARALNPVFVIDEQSISPIKQIVKPTVLNVRSEPDSKSSETVIGKLRKNDVVTASKKSGKWYYVENGSVTGYVHGYYLSNRSIAIDAGHGGTDPGASANGLVEKELNLDVAKRVQKYLNNAGIRVEMTRASDTFIGLNERIDYGIAKDVDTFVSIHGNANTSSYPSGSQTFFSSASFSGCTKDKEGLFNARSVDSCNLSNFIQKRLVSALGTYNRGIDEKEFRVIYKTPLVSTLVELAFLTNKDDASKLASDESRELAAEAIYLGVMDYYKWQEK